MKITDEMVETVAGHLLVTTNETIIGLRDGLEDLLADVPEPGTGGLSGPEALRLRTGYERLKRRAEAAEAKLAKVRECLDMPHTRHVDKLWRITAILDGERSEP